MKRLTIGLLAVALIFGISGSVVAEEKIVEVRPKGLELIETEPRQIVTTTFQIRNTSKEEREFVAQVKLPEGWKLITKEFPFELGHGKSDIRLVSFFVPQKTLAGKYEVTYLVQERKYPSRSDSWTIQVIVLPVAKLEARLLEAPEYVIAGKDYQASFLVINRGNIAAAIILEIESGNNYPATTDTEKFQLGPGEPKIVKVIVETDEKIRKKQKHRLKLIASAPELKNGKVKAEAESWIEVIPRITGIEERFHRIPTEIKLRKVMGENEEYKQGFQTEISGKGTLDEEGKKHVDFLWRGPDIQDKSIFGEHDEYHLSYWTDKYELHLGDRHYSLSPLTEYLRYGRGIEGKLNLGNFTLGGYQEKSRWLIPERETVAGYISYLIAERHRLGLNYLKKDLAESEIFSLRGELKPSENITLDSEYALGKKDGKEDNAYLLKVFGHQRVSYSLGIIHAGPDYPGYYKDMDFKSGSLAFPLWKNLRLNANYREEKKNLTLDPALDSAPLERAYQSGLNWKLSKNTRFSLEYRNRSREDLLPDPEFNFQEETLRYGLGLSFKKLSLHASYETGEKSDKLTEQLSDMEKWLGSATYSPNRGQRYSGYLQIQGDDEEERKMTAGLNVSLGTFNVRWQKRWQEEISISELVDVSLKYGHITLRGRYLLRDSDSNPRTEFLVEYSIPFGVPVSTKKSIGILKGLVWDTEKEEGIADVIIRVNEATAVTDKNGNFTFPSLKPGMYYLEVDKTGISLDKITVQKMPMEVTIEGGKETQVEIGIIQSASLSGQIMVYGARNGNNGNYLNSNGDNNNYIIGDGNNGSLNNNGTIGNANGKIQLVKSHGLPNILVELTNGTEVKRTVTDREGRFEFEELHPGEWILKVYDTNLPRYHFFEKDTFKLELELGAGEEILIKVLPKRRPVKIIREGGTLEEK